MFAAHLCIWKRSRCWCVNCVSQWSSWTILCRYTCANVCVVIALFFSYSRFFSLSMWVALWAFHNRFPYKQFLLSWWLPFFLRASIFYSYLWLHFFVAILHLGEHSMSVEFHILAEQRPHLIAYIYVYILMYISNSISCISWFWRLLNGKQERFECTKEMITNV